MNALALSGLMTLVIGIIVDLAMGGTFGQILHVVVVQVVFVLCALWWRMDIMKWVANKEAIEKGSA